MNLQAYQSYLNSYTHLSLRDLVEAQDFYHIYLMNHPHVVATAIGRYRIRHEDDWPDQNGSGKKNGKGKRTLENSEVRPYSWPAVLVFVDEWQTRSSFREGGEYNPQDMVPTVLYLPDGGSVPVCVIEAPRDIKTPPTPEITYPLNNIGGGRPIITHIQGRDHVATIACLVRDGHKVFALTNHHVAGDAEEILYTKRQGRMERVGIASPKYLTRIPFMELYPGLVGKNVYVNLDVGLVEIDNLDDWTAQIEGIGTMGPMLDLSGQNLSLDLIGCHVRGHGSASGQMLGEIHALFYRYKSLGGFDYIADFFIGPRSPGLQPDSAQDASEGSAADLTPAFSTHPGDSGTLFLLEPPPAKAQEEGTKKAMAPKLQDIYRPIAIQWGENLFASDTAGPQPYALATCLSTVCNLLDIDPVRDWNLDEPETWGAVGHFSIASRVVGALSGDCPRLNKLMTNNASLVAPDDQTLLTDDFKGMGDDAFVHLADVPDFFWKHGHQGHSRFYEGPNHFADMDHKNPQGEDLLTLCKTSKNIAAPFWNQFYDSVRDVLTGAVIPQKDRGLLPFRIWQIFDEMVRFARENKSSEFVCAAGVLTHYIGDACQPLHISYLHDGDPLRPLTRIIHHHNGTDETVQEPSGKGVHSAYEDDMVNANRRDILAALDHTPKVDKAELIKDGLEAAQKTIELMRQTFTHLAPADIVQAYIDFKGKPKDRTDFFWKKFGKRTQDVMQDGTHLLAVLWESAWVQGNGEANVHSTKAITKKQAMNICGKDTFLESLSIGSIGAKLVPHTEV